MATATRARKAKTAPAPEPEVEEVLEEQEKDYTTYLEKAPTDLQERFTQWIQDVTGYEPNDMDDFAWGVQLGTALRMEFQRSPENQEILAEKRAAAAAKKEAREAAPPKPRGRPKKAAAPVEDELDEGVAEDVEEEAEEAPKPKRRGRPAKTSATTRTASKASATKTTSTRGRRAKVAAKPAEDDEAPF